MSSGACITVQLGQCGNQLGRVVNDTLFAHLAGGAECKRDNACTSHGNEPRKELGRYFEEAANTLPTRTAGEYIENDVASNLSHNSYLARSILVDMETKVVQNCLSHTGTNQRQKPPLPYKGKKQRTPARGSGSRAVRASQPLAESSQSAPVTSRTWSYRKDAAFVRHSGSGNNWAAGYNTHATGPQGAGTKVMELMRVEAERADYGVSSFLLLQSLAGGTGSGLGARVSELLRDEYGSRALIANTLVAPYSAGEVSVQLYNSLLTLTHTSQSSDAVMLFRNDHVQSICRSRMRITRPSFDDLNKVIAGHLASALLLPSSRSLSTSSSVFDSHSSARCLEESVANLCPHPSYKMLGVKMLPQGAAGDQSFDSQTWRALLRRLHQMQLDPDAYMEDNIDWSLNSSPAKTARGNGGAASDRNDSHAGGCNRTIAATLTLRGIDATDFISSPPGPAAKIEDHVSPAGKNIINKNLESYRFPPGKWISTPGMFLKLWDPHNIRNIDQHSPQLSIRADSFSFDGWERTATLVSNSQSVVAPLTRVASHAREMWEANAYVHQYEMHGFERDELAQAFEDMDQIVHDYTDL